MVINPSSNKAYSLLHNGVLALARAERYGIQVDVPYIRKKKEHLTRRIDRMEEEFKQTKFYHHWERSSKRAVNIHSGDQLAHFLYDVKKYTPLGFTDTGKGKTDEESLLSLGIAEISDLITIRKLKKVRDTYLDAFEREQVDGILHPFFNLHLVRTYRSSSDSPNFQNIPKRDEESMQICRKAIIPREGNQLLEVDFSGLEVRIAACYHKDPVMLRYINDPKSDMHADMAKQLFKIGSIDKSKNGHNILRQAAKNGFVFPEFYGDYYRNCAKIMSGTWGKLPQTSWKKGMGIELDVNLFLSDHLISQGLSSYDKFEAHVKSVESDFWSNRFRIYQQWKENHWDEYLSNGYIDLYTGFRCSGVMGKNDCINYPVQGTAFHCLLWSFTQMDEEIIKRKLKSRLIGQIHDSMIIDVVPSELKLIGELAHEITCERLPKLWDWIIVPLDVDAELSPINGSWAEKTKYKLI